MATHIHYWDAITPVPILHESPFLSVSEGRTQRARGTITVRILMASYGERLIIAPLYSWYEQFHNFESV